jgi:hypothetical protein
MRAQCFPALGGSITDSLSPMVANGGTMIKPVCASEFRCRWSILLTFKKLNEIGATPRNLHQLTPFAPCPILDARQLVDTMKKILLATVAILAFAAPSFAAETAKTVGQAPPSFYLAQDTATMKCQIVEAQPVAGGSMKVIGAAHSTKESAETAWKADKTCTK